MYNILILSNPDNPEYLGEDKMLADAFTADGHNVSMKWIDYDESLDTKFDIILRRNTWVDSESKTAEYKIKNGNLIERLKNCPTKTVNLEGFDGRGKLYLYNLFREGYNVIPTYKDVNEVIIVPAVEFVLKNVNSFGGGLGQRYIRRDEVITEFNSRYIIQPKLKFKSEVQCYFVENELMYTYEFAPSKYPDYPEPQMITLSDEELELVREFVNVANVKSGFLRLDFLRLLDDSLVLLEIEDNCPNMDLDKLDINLRERVINRYKESVYKLLK